MAGPTAARTRWSATTMAPQGLSEIVADDVHFSDVRYRVACRAGWRHDFRSLRKLCEVVRADGALAIIAILAILFAAMPTPRVKGSRCDGAASRRVAFGLVAHSLSGFCRATKCPAKHRFLAQRRRSGRASNTGTLA